MIHVEELDGALSHKGVTKEKTTVIPRSDLNGKQKLTKRGVN